MEDKHYLGRKKLWDCTMADLGSFAKHFQWVISRMFGFNKVRGVEGEEVRE